LATAWWVDVAAGVLGPLGDFSGLAVDLFAGVTASGFGVDFGVRVAAGLLVSLAAVFCGSFALAVPFGVATCGAAALVEEAFSSDPLASVVLDSVFLGSVSVAATGGNAGFAAWTAGAGSSTSLPPGFARGDSGMGWVWRPILAGDLVKASKGFDLSVPVVGVERLLSPLCLRRAEMESWLPSRWMPILPSFSIATKLVRILERGRGESLPGPCGMPGDLPLSGGLVSPFCSNMARRFLTALMATVVEQAPTELGNS
jgi:hypothetical protein